MAYFKDYNDLKEKMKEYSLLDHLFLNEVSQLGNEKMRECREGFDLKIVINGVELNTEATLKQMNNHFEKMCEEAENLCQEKTEKLFKEKVSDKLYDILDNLNNVDQIVKSCVSWEEEK